MLSNHSDHLRRTPEDEEVSSSILILPFRFYIIIEKENEQRLSMYVLTLSKVID